MNAIHEQGLEVAASGGSSFSPSQFYSGKQEHMALQTTPSSCLELVQVSSPRTGGGETGLCLLSSNLLLALGQSAAESREIVRLETQADTAARYNHTTFARCARFLCR